MPTIRVCIDRIINIGVGPELDIGERKRTRLLNLFVLSGQVLNLMFAIVNLIEGHLLNAALLVMYILGSIIFFLINSYHHWQTARAILSLVTTTSLSIHAILFQNGNEYYLLANIIVVSIVVKKRWLLILLSLSNMIAFLCIRYLDTEAYAYDPMPPSRVYINIGFSFVLLLLTLLYYKQEHLNYETKLEDSKKKLEEQNMQLEEENTTKQKLFSIIAHDLRSPIGQLRNSLDLVNRQLISQEEFLKFTEHISQQVKQLQGGLDNLLKWSTSQLEGIEVNPDKVDFRHVMTQVLSLLQAEIENKQLLVNISSSGGPIWADPDHLLLVLRNLLSNAIKYSYKGGTIHIKHTTSHHEVIIAVADEGDGIDKVTRDILFSPANIISRRGTLNEKGTGLGLKLCKEFVEKNNGRIWIEDNEPRGVVFYVSFPATL